MYITVEISYYPLIEQYSGAVQQLLDLLSVSSQISVETGAMSTLISGEYETVMEILQNSLKPLMEKYPSVFVLKIANACKVQDK